jgi:hypothetical protein
MISSPASLNQIRTVCPAGLGKSRDRPPLKGSPDGAAGPLITLRFETQWLVDTELDGEKELAVRGGSLLKQGGRVDVELGYAGNGHTAGREGLA